MLIIDVCQTERQSPDAELECLTEKILDAAAVKAAAAAQAASLAKAQLAEAEVKAWLKDMDARLEVIFAHPEQNLGEIEEQLAASVKEPLRLMAQRAAQVKANAVPCQCPEHHSELTQQKYLCRTIHSRFGRLTFWLTWLPVSLGGRFYNHYYLQFLPSVCLLRRRMRSSPKPLRQRRLQQQVPPYRRRLRRTCGIYIRRENSSR